MPKTSSPSNETEPRSADLAATGIIDVLRQELAAGVHDTDTLFTELALSERFGVSRTPVREALLSLERDGLLVQRGRSFGLPQYSAQQMANLFTVRQRLEPYAFRRIVETQPAAKLDAYVQWAREQLQGNTEPHSYIAAHQKIRTALLQLCQNPIMRSTIEMFDHQTAFIRQRTLRQPESLALSIQLTQRLLDALEQHDPEATEAAAIATLQGAHEAIKSSLPKGD